MTYDFMAKNLSDGRLVSSSIVISSPLAIAGGSGDYGCEIVVSGFIDLSMTIYGAFAFQATALAYEALRTRMILLEREWAFYFDDEGPVTFNWHSHQSQA